MSDSKRVYVGSDHGGVEHRRHLIGVLRGEGVEVVDELGPASAGDSVDYPDVAVSLCKRVLEDPGSFGLLVCGTGQGMAISANKIRGIRAGVCSDPYSAARLRQHNDANVLCLGGRVLGLDLAATVAQAFFGASFEGGRHERRVGKIKAIEE